ncbi:MAG: GTP-binding protein [bacterium]|nr:GTP-binding protein [bacterium]
MTIPVHIVSGFLGSGKTTLMNHILNAGLRNLKPAILVNDFGKIALDGDLIHRPGYAMKELASGCVCCSLKGPMTEALAGFARNESPDVILMETTGVAIPAEIGGVFRMADLRTLVHLGNVICVVDASSFLKYETHFSIMSKQVQQANTIVLNKMDLVQTEARHATRRRIDFLSQPDCLTSETDHCKLDPEIIFEKRPVYFPTFFTLGHDNLHDDMQSLFFESDAVLSLAKLHLFLKGLPPHVIRAKGIVNTEDGPKLIQLTLSGYEVTHWEEAIDRSRLIFIGKNICPEDTEMDELTLCNM